MKHEKLLISCWPLGEKLKVVVILNILVVLLITNYKNCDYNLKNEYDEFNIEKRTNTDN